MSYYTRRLDFSQQNGIAPARVDGFTLLELILVISIIGIVAVMVLPNLTALDLGIEYESRHVLDDIRYAQAMSMATGQRYRFVRLTSNSYGIYNETGAMVTMPNGLTTVTLSSGVSFASFANMPANLLAFDSLGVPYIDATVPGTALTSVATIVLASGVRTKSISIIPSTGFGVVQ